MKPNTENLTKLADYLDSLPDDYSHFDMMDFFDGEEADTAVDYLSGTVNYCGSAACALGHGPNAGVKVDLNLLTASIDPYDTYCRVAFGLEWGQPNAEWCFGGGWANYDNTPKGAAARIRYLLDEKPVPPDFGSYDFSRWSAGDTEYTNMCLALYQPERKPA